jgi:hypothetical protein
VSRLLLDHLQREERAALEYIADETFHGRGLNATLASGGLQVNRSLWGLLHPPDPKPEEAEEVYVDPGTIVEPQK